MADPRGYLKLAFGFPEHPKVEAAGGDAAWLHVCVLAYCSRNLTDGFFPTSMVMRLSDREDPKQLASRLLEVCLWHAPGHECPRCPPVPPGKYLVHDYLEHQNSAERIREIGRKRADAGQRGGQAKAARMEARSKSEASCLPFATHIDKEQEQDEEEGKASATPAAYTDPAPQRPDVDALCNRLHDLILANGSRKPAITKRWRDAARLMLDADKRDFDKAMRLIEWSQTHGFWKANILSMPTFREKYDQLRLQANEQWEKTNGAIVLPFNRPGTYDVRAAQTDAAVEALEREHGYPFNGAPAASSPDFGEAFRRIEP